MSFVIIPLQGLTISNSFKLFDVEVIPSDQLVMPVEVPVFDVSGEQDRIKKSFLGKTVARVHFSAEEFDQKYVFLNPEDDARIMDVALAKVESVLDVFRLFYCDISSQEIVINKAGNVRDCYAVGLLYSKMTSMSKYVELKTYSSRSAPSKYEVFIEVDRIKNMLGPCTFTGEVGKYLKFALRHYREIIFQDNKTTKFLQIMTLFEYLGFPEGYRPFKEVKKEIAALIAADLNLYDQLLERFHELTSKEGFGYRTEIVHNGKEIFEFFLTPESLDVFFGELGFYLTSFFHSVFKYGGSGTLLDFYKFRDSERARILALGRTGAVLSLKDESRSLLIVDLNYLFTNIQSLEEYYGCVWDEDFQTLIKVLLDNCRLNKNPKAKIVLIGDEKIRDGKIHRQLSEDKHLKELDINYEISQKSFSESFNIVLQKYAKISNRFYNNDSCFNHFGVVADDLGTKDVILSFIAKKAEAKFMLIRNYHESEMDLPHPYVNVDHVGAIILKVPRHAW